MGQLVLYSTVGSFPSEPLEQFEISCNVCAASSKFLYFFIFISFFFTFFSFHFRVVSLIWKFSPENYIWRNILNFVISNIVANLKTKYPYILGGVFFLFSAIFLINIVGMGPYAITLTSSAVLTFFLSFQFFSGSVIIGVCAHKFAFLGSFLPKGVPLLVSPFLVLIEFVSFVARLFSLAIRLFANIMSGHSLLKILGGFAWGAFFSYLGVLALIVGVVVFLVTFLETVIAFLQSYVFMTLATIYVGDSIILH